MEKVKDGTPASSVPVLRLEREMRLVMLQDSPKDSPPIGAAKQQPTPTAQAAASISMFLDSF